MKRVMLISGTSRGIGRYLVDYYLLKDYIVCGCSRKATDIKDSNYFHFELDVGDETKIQNMIREIRSRFGRIDILINNAAIASMNAALLTPYKNVQDIFKTNFFGTFLLMKECAKFMSTLYLKDKTSRFRIINFCTVATPLKLEGESIYASSKAAVVSFTHISARELAPYNITVNAIGPTPIKTDLIKGVSDEKMNLLINRQAIKRYGEFEDITNVIDFFISPKSDFITGQILYLGGIND